MESVNDSLVLAGEVASAADADKVRRLAERFVAKPEQVVNLLSITGQEQVMLKVRVVEMQRTIIKQLGFNMNAVTGQLGMPQYSIGNSPTFGVNGGFLGNGGAGYALNTTSQPTAAFPFANSGLGRPRWPPPPRRPGSIHHHRQRGHSIPAGRRHLGRAAGLLQELPQRPGRQRLDPGDSNVSPSQAGAPYTVTAASAGIGSDNLVAFEKRYLAGDTTLTLDQRLWLNSFNNQLPNYTQSSYYNLPDAQNSTWVDRSNPANPIQKGMAGSPGLNQAQAMLQAFERVGLCAPWPSRTSRPCPANPPSSWPAANIPCPSARTPPAASPWSSSPTAWACPSPQWCCPTGASR